MKKTTATLILTILTAFAFGQIDDNLTKAQWKPGKENIIYENTILRHEGKNDLGGILNVGFQTFAQVKADIEQRADKEMWTPEKKKETVEAFEKLALGGMIHLYLTRLTIDAANTEMFTVVVRDSSDSNEILRKDLKSDIPNTPSSGSDYWWNYTAIPISEPVNGKIYIYIIDKLGGDNNKFKFEVNL